MPLTVTPVANRTALQADPEHDSQTWIGIAAPGNPPQGPRWRTEHDRCWCSIADHDGLLRLDQGPGGFQGHMPTPGELVLWTNGHPGRTFRVDFDKPVRAAGLDVEATPEAVVPGQRYEVTLTVSSGDASQSVTRTAVVGTAMFIGLRSDNGAIIDTMEIGVVMLDDAGPPSPADFGVNRIELLTPVGNVAV